MVTEVDGKATNALRSKEAPRDVENEIGSRHENETRLRGRSPGTGVVDGLATGDGVEFLTADCPPWVQATVSTTRATNQRLMEVQRVTGRKGDALCRAPLPLQLLVSRWRISPRRACAARRPAGDARARDHRPGRRLWGREVPSGVSKVRGQAADRRRPGGRRCRAADDRSQDAGLLQSLQ